MFKEQLDHERIPSHVAVIMDGNGRWAKKHGKPRLEGHAQGAKAARGVVETAHKLGIKYITLYAFSLENWNRPEAEVCGLMSLLTSSIAREFNDLIKNNVRLLTIGDSSFLDENVRKEIDGVVNASAKNTGLTVVIALSYGSRNEILNASKKLLKKYEEKPFDISSLSEKDFADCLYTAQIPDPELLIRTSGEYRISNFLLWQISYSELYFTDTLWPDFSEEDFCKAIYDYQQRERRFGKTSEQILAE
ncbi:MAG: isoprenyl transferase [Bacteroidales bacterium]|jgi:undecaprenyl diphosphate synthase|nr:isoprenyl transferase [Bacteroidales bacterium]MBR6277961.1 isoprenyl transferase [Bacteroidales bacterium]